MDKETAITMDNSRDMEIHGRTCHYPKDQTRIRILGQKIRALLNEDRQRRVAESGVEVEFVLTSGPYLVK